MLVWEGASGLELLRDITNAIPALPALPWLAGGGEDSDLAAAPRDCGVQRRADSNSRAARQLRSALRHAHGDGAALVRAQLLTAGALVQVRRPADGARRARLAQPTPNPHPTKRLYVLRSLAASRLRSPRS